MNTKREQILAAIRTALTGTALVGNRIYRSRVEPIAREESPAIVVEPINDAVQQITSIRTLDFTLTVRVSVIVRGLIPDQQADPIVLSMHSKLMADLTLGGLCFDIQPVNVAFNFAEADGVAGEIQCDYHVLYRTSVADLSN